MPRRNPLGPVWRRYEVSYLLKEYQEDLDGYFREYALLLEGPLGKSPSEMHRKNRYRGRMEMSRELLRLALRETGPVVHDGRLITSCESFREDPVPAPDGIQSAKGLFVEIVSPLCGQARKCP